MKADVIIVAAGSGSRSGLEVAKQFFEVNGRPVVAYTADVFISCEEVENVVIVLPENDFEKSRDYVAGFTEKRNVTFVKGGKTRMESVFNGLHTLKSMSHSSIVCIHDGVRPFVSHRIISESIKCAAKHKAALTAIAITDTVKHVENGIIEETLDRSKLFAAQTPQTFDFELIFSAYQKAVNDSKEFTDDCAVAEYSGISVHICEGSRKNIKLTLPEDFEKLKMEN